MSSDPGIHGTIPAISRTEGDVDLLQLLSTASATLIASVVVAYFLKVVLEKRIDAEFRMADKRADAAASRLADIGRTSLDFKKSMRVLERDELVGFRVAVEKWEYALQNLLFDYSMGAAADASLSSFYASDKQLFLDVKLSIVKASSYLRDQALEIKLMGLVNRIRTTYYPLISASMPALIDLQAQLLPIEMKMKQFAASNFKDLSVAPNEADRAMNLQLQSAMTAEVASFASKLTAQYPQIAELLVELKEGVNAYIYRPIEDTAIDTP